MTKENVFFGALMGLETWVLGLPWQMLYLWAILMALDVVTGIISASMRGEFASKEMKLGLYRKVCDISIMITLLVAQRVATLNGFDVPIGTIVVGAFCVKEISSIIENYGKTGMTLPPTISKWFKVLVGQIDNKEDKSDVNK